VKRVVVTGLGIVSPLGNDVATFFRSLIDATPGIRRLDVPWQISTGDIWAGTVDLDLDLHFAKIKRVGLDRSTMFALVAARQAMAQSRLALQDAGAEAAGVYWGTGMGGALALEATYQDLFVKRAPRLKPTTIVSVMTNAATGQIGIEFGVHGPSATYSSACSSSAVAIGEAYRAIRFGLIESAIAGGSEALLTEGVVKAWDSLGTLARIDPGRPETSCRPFAADRSGFLLGEGAAALVLEEESCARARGATILAEVVGYGNSTDARHITQPDAAGQARAMRQALAESGLALERIGHINAHGTGTKVGDVIESRAIAEVFGAHAGAMPVSATKALHGHLMGATGAVEFIAAIEAMRQGTAPPTAHLRTPDPECPLDYAALEPRRIGPGSAVMSNSFGFGGNNAVLIARPADV
jgi:3-oxoacyl-[acyl-carrier-protein] synthase II